jgi:hypothetical protein
VAFRYELGSGSEAEDFVIVRELTEFCFAGDYRCWAGTPSNCAEWWIAAMNGADAASFEVPLKFLGQGAWQLRSFADGDLAGKKAEAINESVRRVSNTETLRIELAPAGGFAGVLSPDRR